MIGTKILHYQILEKLGEGGMGVVYKAEDTKLKREVAIKFLPRQIAIAASDEERERFKIEAQAAASLNHPNIATIYNIEEHDDELFIVMEFIEGKELREFVGAYNYTPLQVKDVLDYAIQIASGLQAAHEKGVVHRDLKSANIMITNSGQVKIMDFGLAKVRGGAQLTKIGTTLGTAAYMSPEQARGEEADHRSDIWSLGVVLYEMLTGELPFRGDYEQAVIYAILNEEPKSPVDLLPETPEALQDIVSKSLAKDANARYASGQELLQDLKAAQVKQPMVVATTAGAKRQTSRYLALSVAVLLIVGFAFYFWPKSEDGITPTVGSSDKISIAVLPFENISPDPNDAYFADGMTDELISKLSKISRFRVIARSSVMQYRGTFKSAAEIGRELDVSKLLEGTVRKAGDKLRISVQLVNVETQAPIWSEEFNRELLDVFGIQDEISLRVAEGLKVNLLEAETSGIAKRHTENLDAYSLYLKGRFFWNKRTAADFRQALILFQQAVQEDPNYALAYAGLADTYMLMASATHDILSPREVIPKARAAINKALELDNSLAEVHAARGLVYLHEWRCLDAEIAFEKAIELNPNYASAYQWYSILTRVLGQPAKSDSLLRHAINVDPLSLIINFNFTASHYLQEQLERATREFQKFLSMWPDFGPAYYLLGLIYAQQQRYDEAITAATQAQMLTQNSKLTTASLGYVYAVSGDRGLALQQLRNLQERSKNEYVAPYLIAWIHVGLGNINEAFRWLEKALAQQDGYLLIMIKSEPTLEPIRSDPRYSDLLRKMGLPPQ